MVEIDANSSPSGLCEDTHGEAAALIRRIAKDDAAALAELHGNWCPAMLGIAHRMVPDPQAAEQAVIDAFARIWQRAGQYDRHQWPPFVWAFGILRACCIERLRQPRRKHPARNPSQPTPVPPERRENPRVMPVEDFRRVRLALDQLAPSERTALEQAVYLAASQAHGGSTRDVLPADFRGKLRDALNKVLSQLSRYEI